jgi:hypothetical protein
MFLYCMCDLLLTSCVKIKCDRNEPACGRCNNNTLEWQEFKYVKRTKARKSTVAKRLDF